VCYTFRQLVICDIREQTFILHSFNIDSLEGFVEWGRSEESVIIVRILGKIMTIIVTSEIRGRKVIFLMFGSCILSSSSLTLLVIGQGSGAGGGRRGLPLPLNTSTLQCIFCIGLLIYFV